PERLTRHRGRWVLNSFLPPFPSPAYARMFDNAFSGRSLSPVSAFLAVTARCPLRCPHCSLSGRKAVPELDTAQWRDVIGPLHRLGAAIVGFTGGEPCLRDDLTDLVQAVAQGGAEAVLFTSGAGFDASLAGRLARAGLWSVCVSLDSDRAAEHDAMRGAGAFETAVKAIRLARASGFYTMIGTLATPEAVDGGALLRIHSLARELGVHEMRIVEPMPCGRMTGCAPTALLSPAQIAEVRRFHVETNRARREPKVCAFNQIESPEVFGCGAGTQHLFVDPFGNVCPCDFTPLGFGNVRDAALCDIWDRMSAAIGGGPRERCFIQTNHERIAALADLGLPLSPEVSEAVCREAGPEAAPGFFRAIGRGARRGQETP
ncbi:MAG: radical SAM protein, partial [Armatimonadetes bacterium]|nr:radical SAM protein [Armatimonadota bacterium]